MAALPDAEMPYSRELVLPVVEPHLNRLAASLEDAWSTFAQVRDAASAQMSRASAGARGCCSQISCASRCTGGLLEFRVR